MRAEARKAPVFAIFTNQSDHYDEWLSAQLLKAGVKPLHVVKPEHVRRPGALAITISRGGGLQGSLTLPTGVTLDPFVFSAALNYLNDPLALSLEDVHPVDIEYTLHELRSVVGFLARHSARTVVNRPPMGGIGALAYSALTDRPIQQELRSGHATGVEAVRILCVGKHKFVQGEVDSPSLAEISMEIARCLAVDFVEVAWELNSGTADWQGTVSSVPDLRTYPQSALGQIASMLLNYAAE